MVHSRETRASASEVKFVIEPSLAPAIRDWARIHLSADPYGSGPFEDEYDTTSLYFDTQDFDVFLRRKSFGRAKYRIRRYGRSDTVFLERKLRKPALLIKRRSMTSLSMLTYLQAATRMNWGGDWFHRRLLVRRLQPVCQIAYHRTARVVATDDGPARLTLDCELRASAASGVLFVTDADVPFLENRVILEIKYRRRLPAVFRRLVEEFALQPGSASKYRLGLGALGQVADATAAAPVTSSNASYA